MIKLLEKIFGCFHKWNKSIRRVIYHQLVPDRIMTTKTCAKCGRMKNKVERLNQTQEV